MNETETKYKEEVLIKMTKAAYYESKKDEAKPGKGNNYPCSILILNIIGRKKEEKRDDNRDEGAIERIVKFTGVTDDTVGREEILAKLVKEQKEEVDFTCFERGKTEGMILLKKPLVAKEAVEKMAENPGKNSLSNDLFKYFSGDFGSRKSRVCSIRGRGRTEGFSSYQG